MLPKYKYLLTYRYAEVIFDLNGEFCYKWVDRRSRTFDQMIQAGRSGKQNIVEAVGESDTTKKNEIKLLGISKGSFEELLADYEDFLREKGLEIWPKTHFKVRAYRERAFELSNLSNLSDLGNLKQKPKLPEDQTAAANLMVTLLHMETYLLDRQVKAMIERFSKEGGFTEQLLRGRLVKRKF
ncbi:four helix bundle protein [Candidatus Amesbacteria bacterium]|nr:four helix bundle protein [Candidatus Amesbacteria bacterium]MBI2587515.1 four helix bundle protein [Candidatus Amesbacteria bacterium]